MKALAYIALFFWVGLLLPAQAQQHPSLLLNTGELAEIKTNQASAPLFAQSLEAARQRVDAEMAHGITVPVPKDLAGGFSHEVHKKNFFLLRQAGLLYQFTGQEKYAQYVRDMLWEYKELFHTFDRHPSTKSYAPGKFFWQCLNDANWLVYASQGYDCIYEWLPAKERKALNKQLFRPYADFLSVETPRFFNRLHNHSTWANAAVGMIGLVMDDDELVQRALYGLEGIDIQGKAIDNDGGSITLEGQQRAGFLAQIDHSFSPDGYYTEGPYYQRYAIYPFLIFAQSLANTRPELDIFKYREGVLLKGVDALLQMTDGAGRFFPINDAQKGMSYHSRELVAGVNIAYHFGGQQPELLSLAQEQGKVSLDITGFRVAQALHSGKAQPFTKRSLQLHDGGQGNQGAIGILRGTHNGQEISVVMKYAKHGMGHGHFDQLSYSLYYGGHELFPDYGAARWVNIEQKGGGRYLPENKTWAKQTIAHNTVVVGGQSQFGAQVKQADLHHGQAYLFATDSPVQVMSATNSAAYEGVNQHRTLVLLPSGPMSGPLLLDLFRLVAPGTQHYDMPWHYGGHLLNHSLSSYTPSPMLAPMGEAFGFQHLWQEGHGSTEEPQAQFTWFQEDFFYTLTTAVEAHDQLAFARLGAHDPLFNLRRSGALLQRREAEGGTLFASVTELHGQYSPVAEIPSRAHPAIAKLTVLHNSQEYTAVAITHANGNTWCFALANPAKEHQEAHTLPLTINNESITLEWQGPFLWKEIKK